MTNIVSLSAFREEKAPHWQGKVVCLGCKHEWQGVGPIGTIDCLDCPSCGFPKGVIKNLFGCPEGGRVLRCDCECEIFTIYRRPNDGLKIVRCIACGEDMTDAAFDG